jgi:uncharacterized protein YrzB (UPF0473 family)
LHKFRECYFCAAVGSGRHFSLDFPSSLPYNKDRQITDTEENPMSELYGDDIITITDEEGNEYELEVLSTLEYNGATYLALVPADDGDESEGELEVSILKKVMEDGEEILVTVDDEEEMEAVYNVMMDMLYEEDEDQQKQ